MDAHDETPGERAVKAELKHLKLKFEQEKIIKGLRVDSKSSRVADFYLPKYDIYIEFLGNWNTNNEHRQRYKEKMRVYELNNIKCIWIYPEQLTHTHKVIQEGLLKYKVKLKPTRAKKPKNPITDGPKINTTTYKKHRFKKILFLFVLFILILIFLISKNFNKNQPSINNHIGPDIKYNQIYSDLKIGMSAKDFRYLIFSEGFEWTPVTGESKEFELYRFPSDKDHIKVYFDDIAQKEEGNGWWLFTDAKIIKIELYYDDKKINEK